MDTLQDNVVELLQSLVLHEPTNEEEGEGSSGLG